MYGCNLQESNLLNSCSRQHPTCNTGCIYVNIYTASCFNRLYELWSLGSRVSQSITGDWCIAAIELRSHRVCLQFVSLKKNGGDCLRFWETDKCDRKAPDPVEDGPPWFWKAWPPTICGSEGCLFSKQLAKDRGKPLIIDQLHVKGYFVDLRRLMNGITSWTNWTNI